MKFTPRYFHAVAAISLAAGAMVVAALGAWYGAGLLGAGAIAALLHWKLGKQHE